MARRQLITLSLYGVLMLAALPLALGWVPPNRWYGFRFPGALFAPELWYRINALGGQMFILGLAVCAVVNAFALWLAPQRYERLLPWLSAGLIFINFWLVTTEVLSRLPN
jgi:SdpI/YhfL family protein